MGFLSMNLECLLSEQLGYAWHGSLYVSASFLICQASSCDGLLNLKAVL